MGVTNAHHIPVMATVGVAIAGVGIGLIGSPVSPAAAVERGLKES